MKTKRILVPALVVVLAILAFHVQPAGAKPPPGADLVAVRHSEDLGYAVLGRYELYLSGDGRSWRGAGLAERYVRLTTLAQGKGFTLVAAEPGTLFRVGGVNRVEVSGPFRDPYGGRVGALKTLAVSADGKRALASPGLGVLTSGDGGRSWQPVKDPFWTDPAARQVMEVGFAGKAAVVVTREGVYVRGGDGRFVPSRTGLPNAVRPTAAAAEAGSVLIALPGEGIYQTKDGTSWKRLRSAPNDPIAFLGHAADGYLAAGPFLPLHRSGSRADKWERVGGFSPAFVPESSAVTGSGAAVIFRGRGLMTLDGDGLRPVDLPFYLASVFAALDQPGRLLIGTQGGVFFTEDGGLRWKDASPPSLGSPVSQLLQLSDGRILLASLGSGIFVSSDGGLTWEDWNHRLGTANVVRSVVEDRGEVLAATEKGLMTRSLGGGSQWMPAGRGFPRLTAYQLIRAGDRVWGASSSGVYEAGPGEDFRLVAGLDGQATALAEDKGRILAVIGGKVLIRDSGGKVRELPRFPGNGAATAVAFQGSAIRAGTSQGLFTLKGEGWERTGSRKFPIRQLIPDPAGMRVVTRGAGTYRSP